MVECGVGVEASWLVGGVDGDFAIFDGDALAGVGDDALDDVFFAADRWVEVRVLEDDNLAALGDVALVLELCDGYGQAADDEPVTGEHRCLHTWSFDIEATKDEGVDE